MRIFDYTRGEVRNSKY